MFSEHLHKLNNDPNDCDGASKDMSGAEQLNLFSLIVTNLNPTSSTIGLFNPAQTSIPSIRFQMNGTPDDATKAGISYASFCSLMLANPTLLYSVNFNTETVAQTRQIFYLLKRNASGASVAMPMAPLADPYQREETTIEYDFIKNLSCPLVLDGIDLLTVTILPGQSVNMKFAYNQIRYKDLILSQLLRK